MDPNACAREMVGLAQMIADGKSDDIEGDTIDLANMVLSIDQWLRKGGLLPERWTA